QPQLRLEAVSPSGERSSIDVSSKGEFHLDEGRVGEGYRVELLDATGGTAQRFAYDTLVGQLRDNPKLRVPGDIIIVPITCVSGRVTVCRYILDPVLPFATAKLEIAEHLSGAVERIDPSEIVSRWPHPW